MLTLGSRLATLKYFTLGLLGVAGLKMLLRYADVKLAYAGESTMDRRRVVKDEGREENERENEDSDLDLASSRGGDVEELSGQPFSSA